MDCGEVLTSAHEHQQQDMSLKVSEIQDDDRVQYLDLGVVGMTGITGRSFCFCGFGIST
jgi:hypothetical protein